MKRKKSRDRRNAEKQRIRLHDVAETGVDGGEILASDPASLAKAMLKEVPAAHHERYLSIVGLTEAYCAAELAPLQDEYRGYSIVLATTLCQNGSPVIEGKATASAWAAAIVATIGWMNFLNDPGFPPVKTQKDVAAGFGVSLASMQAKKRVICDALELVQFHPDWTLPSLMERNPLIWMLQTKNGFVYDIRSCSRAEQAAAHEAGLIPYVPADEPASSVPRTADAAALRIARVDDAAAPMLIPSGPGRRRARKTDAEPGLSDQLQSD